MVFVIIASICFNEVELGHKIYLAFTKGYFLTLCTDSLTNYETLNQNAYVFVHQTH